MLSVISYETRVARIQSTADLDRQLVNAQAYTKLLRTKAVAAPTLEKKLELLAARKEACAVLQRLRLNYFALEAALASSSVVS